VQRSGRNFFKTSSTTARSQKFFSFVFGVVSLKRQIARISAQQKWKSGRLTIFKVSVSSYVTKERERDKLSQIQLFVRLLTFHFNMSSKMNQLSCARYPLTLEKGLEQKKYFLNDFFDRI